MKETGVGYEKEFEALNTKIEMLLKKMEEIETDRHSKEQTTHTLSERDGEVIDFVRKEGKVSADQLKEIFRYKGKNAASARLSKLFHEGILEKEYAGRKVYYKIKK